MKKISFMTLLLVCASISLFAGTLKYDEGGNITKRLKLTINETAIDSNAFVQWDLKGDWDKFDYSFTQGKLNKRARTFTVYAKDYLSSVNGEEGILLTITGLKKTSSGDYNLMMVVAKATDNMVVNKEKMNLDLTVNYEGHKKTIMEILLPFIIALVVILLILLVLHVTAKFPKGILQLGHDEVRLKGKKRISVRDELLKLCVTLPEGTDVVFVKKRFVSFQGPCLKEIKNCSLNCYGNNLSKGSVIRPDEEIKGLKSSDGKEIIIRYCI